MRTFVVECYWPGMIELEARATLDRVVRLGGEALPGQSVRLLGCIVLPSDGTRGCPFACCSDRPTHARWIERV